MKFTRRGAPIEVLLVLALQPAVVTSFGSVTGGTLPKRSG